MFNLPEILTIVIGALLALVFIDGIRRAIRIRRSSLKVDLMDVDEYVSKDFEEEWMQGFSDEPSKEELVNTLIPRHLNVQMWKYLLESYASEQAARMLSMENATSNAQDMIKDLTLQFNKARQAAITTEMLEIVGGAEALG